MKCIDWFGDFLVTAAITAILVVCHGLWLSLVFNVDAIPENNKMKVIVTLAAMAAAILTLYAIVIIKLVIRLLKIRRMRKSEV